MTQIQKVEQVEGGGVVASGVYIPPAPGVEGAAQAGAAGAAGTAEAEDGWEAAAAADAEGAAGDWGDAGGDAAADGGEGNWETPYPAEEGYLADDDYARLEEAWLNGEGQRPLVRGSKAAAKDKRARTLAEAGITHRHLMVGGGAGLIAAAVAIALLGNAMAGLPKIADTQENGESSAFAEAAITFPVAESEGGVEISRSAGAQSGESGPYYTLAVKNLSGKAVSITADGWEASGQPVEAWLDCTVESGQTVEATLTFGCAEAPATAKGSFIIYEKGGLPENPIEIVEGRI